MKNKIISILIFIPILLIALIFSLATVYGSVSEADRLYFNHDLYNAIRVGQEYTLSYNVLPSKYTSNVKIKVDDTSIAEVEEHLSSSNRYSIKGLKEGEVKATAYIELSNSIIEDSIYFYCYTSSTTKMNVYDKNTSTQSLVDSYKTYYGIYDLNGTSDSLVKNKATFSLNILDMVQISANENPSNQARVSAISDNLTYIYNSSNRCYDITVQYYKENSYITFMSSRHNSNYTYTYHINLVDEGVNVYTYDDLMYCTNNSITSGGEIIVLKSNLLSASNTFQTYDSNNKSKYFDVDTAQKYKNTNLFGRVSHGSQGNINQYKADYVEIESTYDTKFLNYVNKTYNAKQSTKIKVGIYAQKDIYGNGFSINMHSLTYPNGTGTITTQGETNIKPIASDPFKGPLDLFAITYQQDFKSYKPVASIEGQDNIGLLLKGDNIHVKDLNIKSCDNVSYISNLEYVGTTIELMGNNISIDNSILQNGRNVLRSYSNYNINVSNSIIRFARNFLVKVGSNNITYSSAPNTYPTWTNDDRYDSSISFTNTQFIRSGFFSIGVEAHFNGTYLVNGDGGMGFVYGNGYGGTSKGTMLTLDKKSKFYDWKDVDQIDSSSLIQLKDSALSDVASKILDNFDIKQIIKSTISTEENKKFAYIKKNEIQYDSNGNPQKDNNGNVITKEVTYVHGGVAFYGGGYNYSSILSTGSTLESTTGLNLLQATLTGLITQFSGTQPFNFYIYTNDNEITPDTLYGYSNNNGEDILI